MYSAALPNAIREDCPELPDSRVRDNLLLTAGIAGVAAVVGEVGSSGFVAETIPAAFEVARQMRVAGFEAAMDEMNALGGDTDTIGSIAGQIWGATTGIAPAYLLAGISGADRVVAVADRFAQLAASA
jgi:ADP-ribosylglycohydrolase